MRPTVMLFVGAAWLVVARPAVAQDAVRLSPNLYTVLLENDQVRVLDYHAKPGDKEPMHSHPGGVAYILSSGKARATTRDGKSEEFDSNPGTALWFDAVTHTFEYLGPGDAHVIVIEMKGLPVPKGSRNEATKQ